MIFTADRDEKIRVSRYPECYFIETFLLGHTEYVSSLCYTDDKKLISGGGDDFLIFWSKNEKIKIDLGEIINQQVDVKKIVSFKSRIAVLLDKFRSVLLFNDCEFEKLIEIDGVVRDIHFNGNNLYFLSEIEDSQEPGLKKCFVEVYNIENNNRFRLESNPFFYCTAKFEMSNFRKREFEDE